MGAESLEDADSELKPGDELPRSGPSRFRVVRRLGAGGMGVVYEALDLERGLSVALKTLRLTDALSLYRFKLEFRALAELSHPRLVPLFELMNDGDRWYFTMELIGDAVDLLRWVRDMPGDHSYGATMAARPEESGTAAVGASDPDGTHRTMPLWAAGASQLPPTPQAAQTSQTALDHGRMRAAFSQLAEGVQVLHDQGKLHRDLKPENVAVRRATGDVVLLDFGLIAALEAAPAGLPVTRPSHTPAEARRPRDERRQQETLAMRVPRSPSAEPRESQPGSASSSGVVRAYYATEAGLVLGTVAYMAPEQAMASPLTAASDWYAVGVMLYEALTGRLPYKGSVAEILTAKQSTDPRAVRELAPEAPADLALICEELLRRDPTQRPFGEQVVERLGGRRSERPSQDPIAPIFVGRSHQLQLLWHAFEQAEHGTVVAHVHGQSGAGKSALLGRFSAELHECADTLVVSGRCYEQEFIPFKAVDSLMDALTRHLLQWPAADLAEIMPADAPLLARLFPVFGRLLTDEAPPESPDLQAVRQRAFAAMRELLGRLGQRLRLVLSIDDLQWGDIDSSALLAEVLRTPAAPRLLLVFAYRSEHRETNACLRAMSAAARTACGPEREFELDVGSLAPPDAAALARELMGSDAPARSLDWVLAQASGSAFLIHELTQHLRAGGTWRDAQGMALDDILWERVAALEPEPRALVCVIAIAGRPIGLVHAQHAAGASLQPLRVLSSLRAARLVRTEGSGPSIEVETFHDRVRESILLRMTPAETRQHATALARVLEASDATDPETLGMLYERAGEPDRASGHYAAAVSAAVGALAFERAEALSRKAIALAQSDLQLAAAYEAAIHFYTDMARFPEAYALTRRGVRAFGLELPERSDTAHFARELLATQLRLLRRKPADLLHLPTMSDGRLQLAIRLTNAGAKAAFQVEPLLCIAICTKVVRLCLIHGNTPDCAIGYMVFGAIFQGGILGRYRLGHELGQLALALIDKYRNERQRAEVSFVVGYFGTSWLRPAREAEALWEKAFEAGKRSGDLFHMGCAAAGRVISLHMRGAPLPEIEREVELLLPVLDRSGLDEPARVLRALRQAARDLRGATASPGSWTEADYDDGAQQRSWSTFGARHFAHYCQLARAQNHYLWGQLTQAERCLRAAEALASESKGMLHSAEHVYLAALIRAARAGEDAGRSRGVVARLKARQAAAKLLRWSRGCPTNFEPKAELVRAEHARLSGRIGEALLLYTRASASGEHHGHIQVAAIAHLRAASLQAEPDARARSLEAARSAFTRWGASALAARV